MNNPFMLSPGLALALGFLLAPATTAQEKVEPMVDGKTVAEWRKLLKDDSVRQRYRAVVSLAKFGSEAKEAVPDLVHVVLNDGERDTMPLMAARALAQIGPAAVPAAIDILK